MGVCDRDLDAPLVSVTVSFPSVHPEQSFPSLNLVGTDTYDGITPVLIIDRQGTLTEEFSRDGRLLVFVIEGSAHA
jgi:hypothetical protein